MPSDSATSAPTPRREPETTKGRPYPSVWLPWSSNGLAHGLKRHPVNQNGTVREVGDRAPKPKPEGIRMRQARRFAKRGI